MKKNIKKYNGLIVFLFGIFIMGIILGIFYYFNQINVIKSDFKDEIENINNLSLNFSFGQNIVIILILFLIGFTVIGYPLLIIYLFYQGMVFSFTILLFTNCFNIQGLIFSILYYIIYKLIYLILIFYLTYHGGKNCYIIINALITKNNLSVNSIIKNNYLKLIIILVMTFIINLIYHYLGDKIYQLLLKIIT